MGPIKAVTSATTNSFNFYGRASRSEFWWFFIIITIISFFILVVSNAVFGIDANLKIPPIGVFTLLALLPYAAVLSRRLNDVGSRLWQQIVYWLYIPLAIVTKFMLSDALPQWASMTYALFVLIWLVLWIFVHIQLLRKGQGENEAEYADEDRRFVPELYVPPAQSVNY